MMRRQHFFRAGILAAVLAHAVTSGCHANRHPPADGTVAAPDQRAALQQHIRNLRAEASASENVAAREALLAAGTDAFPALIEHFGDRDVAADCFWGAVQ